MPFIGFQSSSSSYTPPPPPDIYEVLLKLTKQLYPTGRAFKIPYLSDFERLHKALDVGEGNAVKDAIAIQDSVLPDNPNFTTDDATDWERRLGLITNQATALSLRMLAIKNKLNYPTLNPAKEHWQNLEAQLQAAGFNVYVYENRFPLYPTGYFTKTPIDITGDYTLLSYVEHGQIQHGQAEHGYWYNNKVANHIDESRDLVFDIGNNFRSTFFVGGNPIGSYASVPTSRKNELRQMILKLKPVQTVAFLFITYT